LKENETKDQTSKPATLSNPLAVSRMDKVSFTIIVPFTLVGYPSECC
jgi:hypothetical protein